MEENKLDIYSYMTDEMKEVLKIQESSSNQEAQEFDLNIIREGYEEERKFWNEDAPTLFRVFDKLIDGPHGSLPIRFYYPNDKDINSCIIFIHGGGFILGNSNTHDKMARNLSKYSNSVVVSIDYKLSPEYKFPVALEECAFVIEYLRKNASRYELDSNSISLAGDSAGANLSLGTVLLLRDKLKDISFIKSLALFYGLFGLKDSVSRRLLGGNWDGLNKEDLKYYETSYLNNEEESNHPYYDCLNADLSYSIPPIYLAVAELDPLKDDSFALEAILKNHNVPCKLELFKGMLHSFLHYSKIVPEAKLAVVSGAKFLNEYSKN